MSSPVNVDIRGYGKIYKLAMRDRELPLLAKAIYSYFCAYAGNGVKSFPRRDKIVRDLNINKDTFTKHLNLLVGEGYIAKERTSSGNIYTVVQTVPRYAGATPAVGEAHSDMLIMENIRAQGFGTVPKLVMLDQCLSAQAKAIYAYFASFAGAGTTAFPRRTTVMRELCMTEKTYYKHFNQLLDAGYISVEQQKTGGKFDVSLYRLAEVVEQPSLPRKGEGEGKVKPAMSEKLPSGENGAVTRDFTPRTPARTGMSEKLPCGDKQLKTSETPSEKVMSEKLPSEEFPQEKPGHANIKNRIITNSFQEKEQGYYHQGGAAAEDKTPVTLLSLAQVKAIMRYDDLRCEALTWGELKEKLGHFAAQADKARYMRRIVEILDEIAKQARDMLNAAQEPQRVAAVLESKVFTTFFDEVLNRWDEIRSAKGYVGAALKNMLKE